MVGRPVLVNRHRLTIIGVAAPTFRGIDVGQVPSIWIPASMSSQSIPGFNDLLNRRARWMQVLGRLNQAEKLSEAQAGLQPWFKAMLQEDARRAEFPVVTAERRQEFLNSSLVLTSAPQGHSSLRRRLSEPLWVLSAVTAVLLGLACNIFCDHLCHSSISLYNFRAGVVDNPELIPPISLAKRACGH